MNWLELVDLAQFQMFSYSETQDKGSATVWACFCCGGGLKRVGGGPRVTRAKHAHAFELLLGHVLWHAWHAEKPRVFGVVSALCLQGTRQESGGKTNWEQII